jgi:transposase-like protein
MDPTTTCCPNLACPARGQTGQGNIGIHSQKDHRFMCTECHKTFTATKGPAFYRLRTSAETISLVMTLMAHGCPRQAIVGAFGYDERTVTRWRARGGGHGQAVQEHLVEPPRDLGQVQADESRVKKPGGIVWLALAMMISTRLWLGGEVREHRDMPWIRRLIARGRRCALHRPLLCCTDGVCAYIRAIRETFRDPVRTGEQGRPRLRPWRHLCIAQVVKRYAQRRVVDIERRIVDGTPAGVETLRRRSHGAGVINTAYIERLNATFRERLASLTRRGRALARHTLTLQHGMYLIGTVYNFCTPPASLRLAAPGAGGRGLPRTPAMAAGITDHGWSVRELLSYHVPPPHWTPPKQRGRPSHTLKRLVERWCL